MGPSLLEKYCIKEKEFWTCHGFPDYETFNEKGDTSVPHQEWIKVIESDGAAYHSPMSRKMFVLGWLNADKARAKLEGEK